MSLPADLLELADTLARMERTRPKQVTLRRAVSTAYYALFHLLTSESVALLGRNLSPSSGGRVQRWFDHGEMKKVAGMFSSATPPRQLAPFLPTGPSVDIQKVALAFMRLQEARHQADYDPEFQLDRQAVLDYLQLARDAFAAWHHMRDTHEANLFALALLSPKLFERQR